MRVNRIYERLKRIVFSIRFISSPEALEFKRFR